jgi:hypothetical protein
MFDHPRVAAVRLAVLVALEMGVAALAEPPPQDPVPQWQRLLRGEDERRANELRKQVAECWARAEFEEALPPARELVALRSKVQGRDHWEAVGAQWQLKAIDRLRELEVSQRKQAAELPALGSRAAALEAKGRAREALALRQQALDGYRKLLGDEHPDTAAAYNNLALNQNRQGRYAEAEGNFKRALDLYCKLLGDDHPDTAAAYNNLADNQYDRGRYTEAEANSTKAVDARERIRLWAAPTGLERASVHGSSPLLALAAVLARNGKPAEAWRRLEQGLARGTWDDLAQRRLLSQQELDNRAMLRRRLELLDRQLEQALAVKDASRRDELLKPLSGQRLKALEALQELAKQLDSKYGPAVGEVFDRATVQRALPADTALLAWVDLRNPPDAKDPGGEHWAVLLRQEGEPAWVRLPGTGPGMVWADDDGNLAPDLRKALVEGKDWKPLAEKLREQRFGPLREHLAAAGELPAVRHLVVLPSTYLKDVPVEVIAPRDCVISYAPSGTTFAYLQRQGRPAGRGLLALADPVFDPRKEEKAAPLPPGGLLVEVVVPGGAAAKADLRRGDVLLRYAGAELKGLDDLDRAIAAPADGKRDVELSVWREGEKLTLSAAPGKLGVVLAKEPAPKALASRREEQRLMAQARSADDGGPFGELPATRVEAEGLRRLFHKQGREVTLLLDSDASEQRLDALARAGQLKGYRYLHLATHGKLDDSGLLRSRLILSRDNLPDPDQQLGKGEPIYDGNLTAAEALLTWKLDAELVTLSACETALGKYELGEGFVGFPQALLLAGSRSVCVSLWNVNDTATALLMTRFYENLLGAREGLKAPLPKAEALREAK